MRQLREHTKPVVLLNIQGFYEPLIALFEHYYREGFAKPWRRLYAVYDDVAATLAYVITNPSCRRAGGSNPEAKA